MFVGVVIVRLVLAAGHNLVKKADLCSLRNLKIKVVNF